MILNVFIYYVFLFTCFLFTGNIYVLCLSLVEHFRVALLFDLHMCFLHPELNGYTIFVPDLLVVDEHTLNQFTIDALHPLLEDTSIDQALTFLAKRVGIVPNIVRVNVLDGECNKSTTSKTKTLVVLRYHSHVGKSRATVIQLNF